MKDFAEKMDAIAGEAERGTRSGNGSGNGAAGASDSDFRGWDS